MFNRWKSRYGDCYVSFPSTIKELELDYLITNFVEGGE